MFNRRLIRLKSFRTGETLLLDFLQRGEPLTSRGDPTSNHSSRVRPKLRDEQRIGSWKPVICLTCIHFFIGYNSLNYSFNYLFIFVPRKINKISKIFIHYNPFFQIGLFYEGSSDFVNKKGLSHS